MENTKNAPVELYEPIELYKPEEDSCMVFDEITKLKLAHLDEITELKLAHLDEITELKLAHNEEKMKMCDEHLEAISNLKEGVDYFCKKYSEANKKCVKLCLVALVEWLIAV